MGAKHGSSPLPAREQLRSAGSAHRGFQVEEGRCGFVPLHNRLDCSQY